MSKTKAFNELGELFNKADKDVQTAFRAEISHEWDNWRKTWRYGKIERIPTLIVVAAVRFLGFPDPFISPVADVPDSVMTLNQIQIDTMSTESFILFKCKDSFIPVAVTTAAAKQLIVNAREHGLGCPMLPSASEDRYKVHLVS